MKSFKERFKEILLANIPAIMAITNGGSDYNGDVIADIYKKWGTGNEVIEKGAARLEMNVRTQKALPRMRTTDSPIGAYAQTPAAETATTSYDERILEVQKGMLYETFDPDEWQDIWDEFASQGAIYTNIAMNPAIMSAIFSLYQNSVGRQISSDFWQGSTVGGDLIDGITTLALADATVVDIPNVGVITQANAIAIVSACWSAVPDHFFENPNYVLNMNTTDYKLLQLANQAAAAGTDGHLNNVIKDLFLGQRIRHFAGMPKNSIIGCVGSNSVDSNLVLGFYAMPDSELGAPRVDRVANNSEEMFVRVNFKYGAQYREGSDIILYTGV